MRDAHYVLLRDQRSAINIAARYIGGILIDRAVVGQEGATQPYTPVSREEQKGAMALLAEYSFSAHALETPADLTARLQPQRRGFDFFDVDGGEDPKPHTAVLDAQKEVLAHLLHHHVQNRILDTATYGNEYPLDEVMADLTTAIFQGDAPNSFQQGLQLHFTDRLLAMVDDAQYHSTARAVALGQVKEIEESHAPLEADSPHAKLLLHRIRQALEP